VAHLKMWILIVGWVEATKPFDYAVPERSRRAGQRPTSQGNLCWISPYRNPIYSIFSTETGFLLLLYY